jgi:hypothetical protein
VIRIENFQKTIVQSQFLLILKDPITILYDNLEDKIGNPQDLAKVMENSEGIEIDKAVDIPQPEELKIEVKVEEKSAPEPVPVARPVEQARTAPSSVVPSKAKDQGFEHLHPGLDDQS